MNTWQKTTVGKIATGFLSGGTPATSRADFWKGDIPWITSKWLGGKLELTTGEKLVSSEAVKKSATKIVPKDSIIFATRVGVGKVGINRIALAINQDLAGVLIDSQTYDIKFLAYQLGIDSIQQYVAMNKRGATIKGITRDCLEQIRINVPPLPEQKKIAYILTTVQRAIEAQERIIQTTTELKKALMHKLFTEGLRNEPQKQCEIGLVPESWAVVKLGKHIQISHGYAFKGEFFVADGPTVLTPGNFKLDGGLYWGKRTKYTTESYEPNVVLNPGELVVVMTDLTPTAKLLGGPAFIPEGRTILHNQRIGKVVLKSTKTTLQFLYWVFLSESFKRYMWQTATGSTVRHTSPSKINQYAFALPSMEEQAQAVDILAKVDAKLTNAEDKKSAIQDLFRALLRELMTGKTRVHELEICAPRGSRSQECGFV
jgi:type I restriction enzyme S subunit